MIVYFLLDEDEILFHIIWKLEYHKKLQSRKLPTKKVFQQDRHPPTLTNNSKSVLRYTKIWLFFLTKMSDLPPHTKQAAYFTINGSLISLGYKD